MNQSNKPALVVLGAADGSVSTYQRASKLGYHTIAVDIRLNAPGVLHADEFVQVSVRAPEKIAAALLDRDDIVGVLCPASDVGLPALRWLAQHWNLPNPLPEAAVRASVDKAAFRELCERLALPSYRSVSGAPGPELTQGAQRLRFPVLVKPVDSSGSRGVIACAGPAELPAACTESMRFSPSGRLVVEEFLDGRHCTIEALIVAGRVAFHAITERTITPPPYFVTSTHLLPARLPEAALAAVAPMLEDVCAALDYRDGPLTVDAVLGQDDRLYLVEMGARMGGNGLAELIESVYRVDLLAATIAQAAGEPVELDPRPPEPAMVHMLTSEESGELDLVEGISDIWAIPEVVEVRVFVEPGDQVRPYEQAGYKLGYVVLSSADPRRLHAAQALVRERIRFVLTEPDMVVARP